MTPDDKTFARLLCVGETTLMNVVDTAYLLEARREVILDLMQTNKAQMKTWEHNSLCFLSGLESYISGGRLEQHLLCEYSLGACVIQNKFSPHQLPAL